MHAKLIQPGPMDLAALSPADVDALLSQAQALQRAAAGGSVRPLLRGKKLALLGETDHRGPAALFRSAAVELGAHVAHVSPHLSELSTPREVEHMAQLLGRLYDAVECQGMAPALVHRIADESGVPVYDGLATDEHPVARLADRLTGDAAPADKQRFVLQAVLLRTIA